MSDQTLFFTTATLLAFLAGCVVLALPVAFGWWVR